MSWWQPAARLHGRPRPVPSTPHQPRCRLLGSGCQRHAHDCRNPSQKGKRDLLALWKPEMKTRGRCRPASLPPRRNRCRLPGSGRWVPAHGSQGPGRQSQQGWLVRSRPSAHQPILCLQAGNLRSSRQGKQDRLRRRPRGKWTSARTRWRHMQRRRHRRCAERAGVRTYAGELRHVPVQRSCAPPPSAAKRRRCRPLPRAAAPLRPKVHCRRRKGLHRQREAAAARAAVAASPRAPDAAGRTQTETAAARGSAEVRDFPRPSSRSRWQCQRGVVENVERR